MSYIQDLTLIIKCIRSNNPPVIYTCHIDLWKASYVKFTFFAQLKTELVFNTTHHQVEMNVSDSL